MPGEEREIQVACKSHAFSYHRELIECARRINADIASDLYYSIVTGISYDELTKVRYIPIGKADFYGYRRKCLAQIRDIIREGQNASDDPWEIQ